MCRIGLNPDGNGGIAFLSLSNISRHNRNKGFIFFFYILSNRRSKYFVHVKSSTVLSKFLRELSRGNFR